MNVVSHFLVFCSLKPSEKSKELVIPLIQKNRWVKPDSQGSGETSENKQAETAADGDSVDAQAVKELIEGEDTTFLPVMTLNDRNSSAIQLSWFNVFSGGENMKSSRLQSLEGNSTSGKMMVSQRKTSTSASHC